MSAGSFGKAVVAESGELKGEMLDGVTAMVHEETVIDTPGTDIKNVSAGNAGKSLNIGQYEEFTLQEFFKRPVLIDTETYGLRATDMATIRPWDLWSRNAAVRGKLSNYSYFTGDLYLQFNLSGSPYAYGKMLLAYIPYPEANSVYEAYKNIVNNAISGLQVDQTKTCFNNYLSQFPGSIVMDYHENEPVIMKLPFICYKQAFRLFNSATTTISNSTAFHDFLEAGEIHFSQLNPLEMANDDVDGEVAITVYAWCENVTLGNPTATNINITAEMGSKKEKKSVKKITFGRAKQFVDSAVGDEYALDGPVSSIASAIGGAATSLSNVPIIGGYMTATSSVASTIGKIAAWFGFSKPVILNAAMFVKNNPFQNGAVTNVDETTMKIAVDPKQELALCSDVCAEEGPDNMAISEIAKRPSYIATFKWSQTDDPMDTVLWRCLNSPYLYTAAFKVQGSNDATNWHIQPSALMFAAQPFQYWRGSITYRFEVVCSRFHRGKLLVSFEPNIWQESLITAADSQLNQQNHLLVDIQDTQYFEITVDWAYTKAWCRMDQTVADRDLAPFNCIDLRRNTQMLFSTGTDKVPYNGMLYVRPLTRLIQPTTDSSVTLNVYVYSNDLQVAKPSYLAMGESRSYCYAESGETRAMDSAVLNETTADLEGLHLHHFGEVVPSFRALLKRYDNYFEASAPAGTAGFHVYTIRGALYSRPGNPIGFNTTLSPTNWLSTNNLLDYLRYGYLGMRGGMRFRVYSQGEIDSLGGYTKVKFPPEFLVNTATLTGSTENFLVNDANTENIRAYFSNDFNGSLTFHKDSNGGIEFEIPFYNSQLFCFACDTYFDGLTTSDGLAWDSTWANRWYVSNIYKTAGSETIFGFIDRATAEDFNLMRFQGAPFYSVPNVS